MKKSNCIFCSISQIKNNKIQYDDTLNQYVLFKDEYVMIITDVAPIVEHHLLLVSREHFSSFIEFSIQNSEEVLRKYDALIVAFFSQINDYTVLRFEHGSGGFSKCSACIDHAHIHYVPLPRTVCDEVFDKLMQAKDIISRTTKSELIKLNRNYLFLSDGVREYYFEDYPESQLLRRIIAKIVGNNRGLWQKCVEAPMREESIYLNNKTYAQWNQQR